MQKFVTLKELAQELQVDRSHLRRYVLAQGVSPVKVRSTESRGQKTLALLPEDAEFIRQLRTSEGFLSEVPIVSGEIGDFYIIQLIPEFSPNRVKLGFAMNTATRLQAHKTSAPTAVIIKTWPCKRNWEQTAIASVTRSDSERVASEVFDCNDIPGLIEKCDAFFALMPSLDDIDRKGMDQPFTTVKISVETRDRLMALGKKGDTYEEIIRKLLDTLSSSKEEE